MMAKMGVRQAILNGGSPNTTQPNQLVCNELNEFLNHTISLHVECWDWE